MTHPHEPELDALKAKQRLADARAAVFLAEDALKRAIDLLEVFPGGTWGLLGPSEQRERRLLMQGSHLAWAKIDVMQKKVLRGGLVLTKAAREPWAEQAMDRRGYQAEIEAERLQRLERLAAALEQPELVDPQHGNSGAGGPLPTPELLDLRPSELSAAPWEERQHEQGDGEAVPK